MPDTRDTDGPASHALRKPFRKALFTALKRSRRKAGHLNDDIDDCTDAERWLRDGEAIKANLGAIKRGISEVTLPDPYAPGETRTVPLDPCMKPLDNARSLFKKARKLREGLDAKERELAICRRETESLASLLERYDAWAADAPPAEAPPADLVEEASRHRVHVQGLSVSDSEAGRKAEAVDARVREYASHDGWTLLVGKGDRDNDRLSMKVARGNDWWFHVAHYAGSHVVARPPAHARGGEKIADKKKRKAVDHALPQETLLDAATLAVHFSKARGASKAEVHYTRAKHLHKRKGAPAGQVILNQYDSVMVRMEDKRLTRLLGER